MQYDEIAHLREKHSAWVLLRADHAPLVLGFLGRIFVDNNIGDVPARVLIDELDEELYALNQRLGESSKDSDAFPRPAKAYLDEWAEPEKGWLRKFYPPGSDEPHYDLAPAVEKALLWVRELRSREFVGTESRLNTVFELLRQMVFGADEDPEHRLIELRRKRQQLDEEISRAERGDITILDAISQRDRYQQFSDLARGLLSDFREVEENFRKLDRQLRKQIAGWNGSKGELLDGVIGSRSNIAESDQGRSFQAFYSFLLSQQKQAELTDLLQRLMQIDQLAGLDERMTRIHFDWIDAAERTQATIRLLSEQLRRFLDDQVWMENRRVFDILREIENNAMHVRDAGEPEVTMEMDDVAITVHLPMERPLYRPQVHTPIDSSDVEHGSDDIDSSALLEQLYVDRDELIRKVRSLLRSRDHVGLAELIKQEPLQQGVAELVGYISLNDSRFSVVFDDEHNDRVMFHDDDENEYVAELPQVTFSRESKEQHD